MSQPKTSALALVVSNSDLQPVGVAFCIASSPSRQAVYVTERNVVNIDDGDAENRHSIQLAPEDAIATTLRCGVAINAVSSAQANNPFALLRINCRHPGDAEPYPLALTFRRPFEGDLVRILDLDTDGAAVENLSTTIEVIAPIADESLDTTFTFHVKRRVNPGAPVVDQTDAVIGIVTSSTSIDSRFKCRAGSASSLRSLVLSLETDYGGERSYSVTQMARGAMLQIDDYL
jgi:hypothetical protein